MSIRLDKLTSKLLSSEREKAVVLEDLKNAKNSMTLLQKELFEANKNKNSTGNKETDTDVNLLRELDKFKNVKNIYYFFILIFKFYYLFSFQNKFS